MPNIYPGRMLNRSSWPKLVVSPRGTLQPWALERSPVKKQVMWWGGQKTSAKGGQYVSCNGFV